MGLTKLSNFVGEADVLGKTLRVAYDTQTDGDVVGDLTVFGLERAEAMAILEMIAEPPSEEILADDDEPQEVTEIEAEAGADSAFAEEAKPEQAAQPAQPAEEDDRPPRRRGRSVSVSQVKREAAPAEADEPEAPVEEKKPALALVSAADDAALEKALQNVAKFRDVVTYLYENGYPKMEDIEATCIRLRDRVPVLKTIPNLGDRVRRSYNAFLGNAQ